MDDSDVVTTPCDDTDQDGVCRLECLDPSRYISAPTPRYRSCGALGVFDRQHPYRKLVLPTCAGKLFLIHKAPLIVYSEFFARVLFSQNLRSFMKIKLSRNGEIRLLFTYEGKSCPSRKFLTWQMCLLTLFASIKCSRKLPNLQYNLLEMTI